MPYQGLNPQLEKGNVNTGINPPTAVDGGYGDVFILGSALLADNPQILPTYFKQAGYPVSTLAKIRAFKFGRLNMSRAVQGPVTQHYEKPRPNMVMIVGSIISNPSGNTIQFALTSDQMDQEVNYAGATVYYSRPRPGEVWGIGNGNKYLVTAKDTTTNPALHYITVQVNTGATALADITTGTKLFYVSTMFAEGTAQPDSLRLLQYKYQNTFAICKETNLVTGTNMTTEVRFQPVPGSNLLYLEGVKDEEMRHEMQKGNIFMFGSQATNWTGTSTYTGTAPIQGTEGLVDFARKWGYDFAYDPNNLTIDDLFAISGYYNDIRVTTSEIMLFEGYNVNIAFQKYFADIINYSWVAGVSDRYMGDAITRAKSLDNGFDTEGMFINLGIDGFRVGNFTFLQTKAEEFSNAQGAGAVGYKDVFIASPFGKASDSDAQGVPYVGYEYRGTDGYSRENEVWMIGGAGNGRAITSAGEMKAIFSKSIADDVQLLFLRSEIAPHFALGSSFILGHPESMTL
jgi:hypothetical protein